MSQFLPDLAVASVLILGISLFRTPRGARFGNLAAAAALLCAVAIVLVRNRVGAVPLIVLGAGLGSAAGWLAASRVSMIGIPAMVAFQHGVGGVAAFLVSFVELVRTSGEPLSPMAETSALLGLLIGAATFSGSMLAAGKLANLLRGAPTVLPGHNRILATLVAGVAVLGVAAGLAEGAAAVKVLSVLLMVFSVALGVVFAMRIGGADMPVLISFLNATAGLAAAFCGLTIGSRLLIICGATVAASGSVLTHVMCRAMNRDLGSVFGGSWQQPTRAPAAPASEPAAEPVRQVEPPAAAPVDPLAHASSLLGGARKVIIVPGYGMALADAQQEVSTLADKLTAMGKEVLFAIHPVAGRMPGHMHVLLAEAEVDYGRIRELAEVNTEFAGADIALVVGACDVVNPAAIERADTPISGMPILRADEARHVIVCNLDERPGYSGVENPLYGAARTIMLLGDAKATVARLLAGIACPLP